MGSVDEIKARREIFFKQQLPYLGRYHLSDKALYYHAYFIQIFFLPCEKFYI